MPGLQVTLSSRVSHSHRNIGSPLSKRSRRRPPTNFTPLHHTLSIPLFAKLGSSLPMLLSCSCANQASSRPSGRPIVSESTKSFFISMFRNASSHGLTVVNPIDRFVEFINQVSIKSPAFNFALYCAGAYDLVSEVHSGFYDFISTSSALGTDEDHVGNRRSSGLTASQRRRRMTVCVEMQQRMVAYGAVPAADLGRTPILSPSSIQLCNRDTTSSM